MKSHPLLFANFELMTSWRSRLLSPCWSAVHTLIQNTLPTPADTGWFYCGDAESFPVHPSSVWHRVPPPSWLLHIPWKPPAHPTPPPLSLPCLSLSFRCTAAQHVSIIGWLNALSHHSAGMSFNCHSWFWILLCFYMAVMFCSRSWNYSVPATTSQKWERFTCFALWTFQKSWCKKSEVWKWALCDATEGVKYRSPLIPLPRYWHHLLLGVFTSDMFLSHCTYSIWKAN